MIDNEALIDNHARSSPTWADKLTLTRQPKTGRRIVLHVSVCRRLDRDRRDTGDLAARWWEKVRAQVIRGGVGDTVECERY